MLLTNRTGVKNTRDLLRAFGGLNETYGCTEAEYSGGMNFSARDFPALSTRLPRRRLQELAGLNGMYHLNGLLTVCGQDLVYTPDEAPAQPVTVKNAVADSRKTMVGIGTKILSFPPPRQHPAEPHCRRPYRTPPCPGRSGSLCRCPPAPCGHRSRRPPSSPPGLRHRPGYR